MGPATKYVTFFGVLALLAGGSAGVYSATKPTISGSVTVKRDKYGVPHIYSDTVYGLFYGEGYAAGEDRLFQLEMLRRSVEGSVAEVLGGKYLDHDKATRHNFNPKAIKDQLAKLPEKDAAIFDGYAAGLNARISAVMADRGRLLPKEFTDFGFEPIHWTAYDVAMLWVGSMADRFSDANAELENLALLKQLRTKHSPEEAMRIFKQLRWGHDGKAYTTVPAADEKPSAPPTFDADASCIQGPPSDGGIGINGGLRFASEKTIDKMLAANEAKLGGLGPDFTPRASNLWIVGKSKTVEGISILMNGPQMGNFNPAWMWSFGLHGAGFDEVGNSPIGYPFVEFGTNKFISWGSTAGTGDTVDIYQEQLKSDDPHFYMFKGKWTKMEARDELIRVKGAPDVHEVVYSSVHGLVSGIDEISHLAYSRKRTWEGYEIQSLVAWIHSTQATNWKEYQKQAEKFAITINWYYADVRGNIGYMLTGFYPERPKCQDFRLPVSGAGDMEWKGIRPFSTNPQVYNPRQGYIVNWNNKPTPTYNSGDSSFYSTADRVREIAFAVEQKSKLTSEDVWNINKYTSYVDTNARYFLPIIEAAAKAKPPSGRVAEAVAILAKWDRLTLNLADPAKPVSSGELILQTWLPKIIRKTLSADVDLEGSVGGRPSYLLFVSPTRPTMGASLVLNAFEGTESGVPQSYDFLHGRDKNALVMDALEEAVKDLENKFGPDSAKWTQPAPLDKFNTENFLRVPQTEADNMLSFSPEQNRGTENDMAVMYPAGVKACDVAPPGQSGFIAPDGTRGAHYSDQLSMYQNFQCKPEWLKASDVDANLESTEKFNF